MITVKEVASKQIFKLNYKKNKQAFRKDLLKAAVIIQSNNHTLMTSRQIVEERLIYITSSNAAISLFRSLILFFTLPKRISRYNFENPQCYHAIESYWKKSSPQNEFEKIFKDITQGYMDKDGVFYLESGEILSQDYLKNLNIPEFRKNLLELIVVE